MLHSLEFKKAELARGVSEDTLTSSVLGQLFYLPTELMWEILREASYGKELPRTCGIMESFEFWPKWCSGGTDNTRFVEPDLLIQFAEFNMLVEAKRWENKAQDHRQWKAEIRAYLNEYPDDVRPLYFVALGGLHGEKSEIIPVGGHDYTVVMCSWSRILRAVKQALRQLERSSYCTSSMRANARVFNDLLALFRMHGHATGDWFENADLSKWRFGTHQTASVLQFNK